MDFTSCLSLHECKRPKAQVRFVLHICILCGFLFFCLFVFCFLRSHLQHMEVPRLGVESELQLPQPQQLGIQAASLTYTTAHVTLLLAPALWAFFHLLKGATLPHVLNPLSKARDQTLNLMNNSWVCNLLNHSRNSLYSLFSMSLCQTSFWTWSLPLMDRAFFCIFCRIRKGDCTIQFSLGHHANFQIIQMLNCTEYHRAYRCVSLIYCRNVHSVYTLRTI